MLTLYINLLCNEYSKTAVTDATVRKFAVVL